MVSKPTQILLVEDNPADAFLVKEYMDSASLRYELIESTNLYDALDQIRERSIEIVLLDLTLPDSQGFKTLNTFLERNSHVPVVVLTGMNNEIIGNQAIKAGAQDFLVKGQFDGRQLGRAVRYALQRHKDLQKREELVEQLSASEKRYAEAQSIGRFGHWVMDIVSNEMTWTEEVYRVFGLHPNSLQPSFSKYLSLVYPQDKAAVEQFFEEVLRSGKKGQHEHRVVVDGLNFRHVTLSARIQMGQADGKIYLVGVVQDISERKQAEQLLKERNVAENSGKIREETLADLGFHIRTPLSSVVNLLFLLDNTSVSPQQRELLDNLSVSVDDLSVIIHNLMNLAVFGAEKVTLEEQEFSLRELLQSIKKLARIKSDKFSIALDFSLSPNLPDKCIADDKKITQLLYNLMQFAFLTGHKNFPLKISIGFDETRGFSCDFRFNSSEVMELPKKNNQIDTYSTWGGNLESTQHNSGSFGLAVAQRLSSTMRGTIEMTREELSTTHAYEIRVALPMKSVKVQAPYQPGDAPRAGMRILLVEDHFLNQIATKKVLQSWSEHITVDIAENGLVGVEKYREFGYDLVLMDLQMPVMNGIDSAKRIREQSAVPIIALTANASRLEMDKCFEVGMNDYLQKPFKPQELYAKIMAASSK